jgi:hypothetical protein
VKPERHLEQFAAYVSSTLCNPPSGCNVVPSYIVVCSVYIYMYLRCIGRDIYFCTILLHAAAGTPSLPWVIRSQDAVRISQSLPSQRRTCTNLVAM